MKLNDLVDKSKATLDDNGIWVTDVLLTRETKVSKKAWERIHDFSLKELKRQRRNFDKSKIKDHMAYLEREYNFAPKTVYMEIGCGPSHVGDYLMKHYQIKFVGIDFNYDALLVLQKYFREKGYKDFLLIHADVRRIPLKPSTTDFIFGGGVIEHLMDTGRVLHESYRLLKKNGVCFNTVPALNLFWFTKFWMNIPDILILRGALEFLHINVLKNKIFNKGYGYELSFTPSRLKELYNRIGFRDVKTGPFAFHPSYEKIETPLMREIFYEMGRHLLTSPFYFVVGKK